MPNYVANILTFENISEEQFEGILEMSKTQQPKDGKCKAFDFNSFVPMPESLNIESGSTGEMGLAAYSAEQGDSSKITKYLNYPWVKNEGITTWEGFVEYLKKENPDCLALGQKYYENIQKYGYSTWYDWACNYWGTKWNAIDPSVDKDKHVIEFRTAWASPEPIVYALAEKMAEKFPGVTFRWIYADEDCGSNTGEYAFDGSTVDENYPDSCSNDAYSLYIECWGESDCIGHDDKQGYFHYDCETCPHKGKC